jgi:hypothetical protein
MRFLQYLRRGGAYLSGGRRTHRPQRSQRPRLESLEDRLVPSTLINFDDAPNQTLINIRYTGVTFSNVAPNTSMGHNDGNVYALNANDAQSQPNVVGVRDLDFGAFDRYLDERWGIVKAEFATPQSTVSIDAKAVAQIEGLGTPTDRPYLQAYSASGVSLGGGPGVLSRPSPRGRRRGPLANPHLPFGFR